MLIPVSSNEIISSGGYANLLTVPDKLLDRLFQQACVFVQILVALFGRLQRQRRRHVILAQAVGIMSPDPSTCL